MLRWCSVSKFLIVDYLHALVSEKEQKKGQESWQLERLDSIASFSENPGCAGTDLFIDTRRDCLQYLIFKRVKCCKSVLTRLCKPGRHLTVPQEEQTTGDSFKFDKTKPVLNLLHKLFIPKDLSKAWNILSNSTRNLSCPHYSVYCRWVCSEKQQFSGLFRALPGNGRWCCFSFDWKINQSLTPAGSVNR